MGSTQPLGEKSQLSQSGYIIFHELDRLFPMWQGKNRRSEEGHQRWQGVVFSSPGQQVSSSDTQESGASHIPRQPARSERTARPPLRVLGRAGQGRGRAGPRSAAGPARPPPPHSQSKPSTGARGAARNSQPQGGWKRPPATCPAPSRAGRPGPSPPRLCFPRARRPHPAIPARRGHDCPTWPRAWQGPAPIRPYWRPRPEVRLPLGEPAPGRSRGPARVSGPSPW